MIQLRFSPPSKTYQDDFSHKSQLSFISAYSFQVVYIFKSCPFFEGLPSVESIMSPLSLSLIFLCSVLATGLPEKNSGHQTNYQQRNLETITKIYERNVYPTNLQFIANGPKSVPSGLFNENATGRITPLGNFTGFNDSTEYFFALSPIPSPPNYIGMSKIQVVSFQSQCAQFASSITYFTISVINPNATNNGQFISNLKQVFPSSLFPSLRLSLTRCFTGCILGVR